jgi:hypothetical protein
VIFARRCQNAAERCINAAGGIMGAAEDGLVALNAI